MSNRFLLLLDSIKFEHSVFALPFAYLGMVLAARGFPAWDSVLWITVAMVGARTLAMAANRIVDARYDALNPRTRPNRAMPRGLLSRMEMGALAVAGLTAMLFAAWMRQSALPAIARPHRGGRAGRLLVDQALHLALPRRARASRMEWPRGGVDRSHRHRRFPPGHSARARSSTFLDRRIRRLILRRPGRGLRSKDPAALRARPYRHRRRPPVVLRVHALTVGFLALAGMLLGLGWLYWAGLVVAGALSSTSTGW